VSNASRGVIETVNIPEHLLLPSPPFRSSFDELAAQGSDDLAGCEVAIVGLARSCAPQLFANLERVRRLGEFCRSWKLHVETNDNEDNTDQVLADFCREHRQATFTSQRLDRQHFSTEFAGRRTEALAEYRTACQKWVRQCAADAYYVVVIDLDAWGGWSNRGLLNGFGWLRQMPDAYGMASVSLLQHPAYETNAQGETRPIAAWLHYDCWALRLNSYWDDYTNGLGGWKHQWLPPVGSPPVPVCSAMGGLAIYRTDAYLAGRYDGADCEHVTFHESIAEATGQRLYLNPSQRCVMRWLDGGQDSDD
jgi:hypothetical protein